MSDMADETIILFRPVGPKELALIRQSNFSEFPPRLERQPYSILYRTRSTRLKSRGNETRKIRPLGYVTRFRVRRKYLDQFALRTVGRAIHKEYWIPAEKLSEFNSNIVGKIEVVAGFRPPADQ